MPTYWTWYILGGPTTRVTRILQKPNRCAGTEVTQDHIVRCPTYKHLRVEKNLSDDKDLVNYFRKVIDIREKLEDKRNNV